MPEAQSQDRQVGAGVSKKIKRGPFILIGLFDLQFVPAAIQSVATSIRLLPPERLLRDDGFLD